ncbi:MAG: hypothetical protein HY665_08105 [Chloroflexi bacterium]|nr:hypothetical protein [Chloroflexota bacterium]
MSFFREVVKNGFYDKFLWVQVFRPREYLYKDAYDAKTVLENDISDLMEYFKVAQVLERSSANVSGIVGELVVSTVDIRSASPPSPDSDPRGTPKGSQLIDIVRSVYFDYGGLIWKISMRSYEKVAEEGRADFEHVLKTFKILD